MKYNPFCCHLTSTPGTTVPGRHDVTHQQRDYLFWSLWIALRLYFKVLHAESWLKPFWSHKRAQLTTVSLCCFWASCKGLVDIYYPFFCVRNGFVIASIPSCSWHIFLSVISMMALLRQAEAATAKSTAMKTKAFIPFQVIFNLHIATGKIIVWKPSSDPWQGSCAQQMVSPCVRISNYYSEFYTYPLKRPRY